jgi:PAS domain S-box-containing protein
MVIIIYFDTKSFFIYFYNMKFFYETKKHEKKRKTKALDIAEKLKKAEETLFIVKKAAESSTDAIVLADSKGNHFYHNKAFTQLFGYTPEELHAIVDEPTIYTNKDTAKTIFDTIVDGGSWTGEVDLVSKSGNVSVALLRADAIKDDNGKIIGLIGLYTDITERKRVEERLRLRGLTWLSERVPEFGALPECDKKAIQDFLLLWSFFEGTKLNNEANVNEIKKYVESIKCDGSLYQFNIASYIRYLHTIDFANGKFTQFYSGLKMEHSKSGIEYVEKLLQGNSISKEEELVGCLVIIYCLRNNLFHGYKWQYQLQGQYNNFTRVNKLLMELIG